MSKDLSSIEELLASTQNGPVDKHSPQAKLIKKQKEIDYKNTEERTKAQAVTKGLPYFNLYGFPISSDALKLIEEEEAKKLKALCFFYNGKKIRIGTTNPDNPKLKKLIANIDKEKHTQTKIYLVSDFSLKHAFLLYKNLPKRRTFINGVEINEKDLKRFNEEINDFTSLTKIIGKINISDMLTLLLAASIKIGASDIHIESEEKSIAIRFRVDGVMQEVTTISKDKWKKIISRMKLLAKVKINIDDKPQDGRFTIFLDNEHIEVRVSFLPTSYGESVVLRLLRSKAIDLPFEELGLLPETFKKLKKEIKKPNGLILNTGPTGSGKTTTLYAILKRLNKPETKIVTLEDPIEYRLEGISQSQVDHNKGYTFAKGLRSIVRQDPDIIMVGEIRDLETATIAIQASLTGHLVLSTLHTNDAAGVIPRLIDLGVKPYFIPPAINAILGQRLVRRLCPFCRIEHKLNEAEKEQVDKILSVISPKAEADVPMHLPKIFKAGKGCAHCSGIGYKGRIGIVEIFTMTDDIKQLAHDNAPAFKILQQAIENGMITMLQDGVLKCLQGITSLEEVYRVIGKFDYIDTLYDIVLTEIIGRGIKLSPSHIKKGNEAADNLMAMQTVLDNTETRDMLHVIMAAAIKVNAGDVHIEPTENAVVIRFRIDGILHTIATLSKDHYLPILSKIKISAGFPTNVKKPTWDGRFSIIIDKVRKDSRLSIISGGYGETAVIRLYAAQAAALDMDELGMREHSLAPVERSIARTRGIILTTGPTGSGKTTTLYSILNKLNRSDIKIITIEDPIEYHLEGVMQTQIDTEQGYSFTSALRSLLRQNPNIIMIGEVRDEETAKIAIESSLTGHLVLSTVHANSAAGAITRFIGLGVSTHILANSINSIIGQRLVRVICPHCKQKDDIKPEIRKQVDEIIASIKKDHPEIKIPEVIEFFKGAGCKECGGLGYKGRMGIFETIEMQPEIQKVMQKPEVTDYDIEQLSISKGTVLMIQDGILKALAGETTVSEVFRVVK